MTPYQYAALVGEDLKYEHRCMKIKGPGHLPRTPIDHSSRLWTHCPSVEVCTSKRGGVRHYTADSIVHRFKQALLSAGINPDAYSQERYIVNKQRFAVAVAIHRLTGQLPATDKRAATLTAATLKTRETRSKTRLTHTSPPLTLPQ